MSYYMRFFHEEGPLPGETQLGRALAASGLELRDGEILRSGETVAAFEVSHAGDEAFTDEIEEFQAALHDVPESPARRRVADCLAGATAIVTIAIGADDDDFERTLERLDPVWHWLFDHCEGLLHADDEGYYDTAGELVLELV